MRVPIFLNSCNASLPLSSPLSPAIVGVGTRLPSRLLETSPGRPDEKTLRPVVDGEGAEVCSEGDESALPV